MKLKSVYVAMITIISLAIVGAVDANPPTALKNLTGTWHNTQPRSNGVVKIVVTSTGGLKVHAYGSCSPTPCDWGTVDAKPFSKNVSSSVAHGFSAEYTTSFSSTLITAVRKFDLDGGSYLEVQIRTSFVAGDSRYDYESIEMFRK